MLQAIKNFIYKLTHWETWHYHAKYIPLLPVWLWYCLRSRSLWFFTTSNPTLSFGGMEGESKEEMYESLPPGTYPRTIYISPGISFSRLMEMVRQNNFSYPFAVKPNVGMMGFMFRRIESADDLKLYHEAMSVNYVLQELINYANELSVFYYRMPSEKKGIVSGLLLKQSPFVVGDGKSTLKNLIHSNPAVRFKLEEMESRHHDLLLSIIPKGQIYQLSDASNRSQGGNLISLNHLIDERLINLFDDISHYSESFFYGRYDIKCTSIEDLKEGKNFSILEYNGSGSGIQHVYGNNHSLLKACSIILHHWKMLFKISRHNHLKGIAYWNWISGLKFLYKAKQNLIMLKKLDAAFPAFIRKGVNKQLQEEVVA